jgi:hypothetical protein
MNHKLIMIALMLLIAGMALVSVPIANKRTAHLSAYKGGTLK